MSRRSKILRPLLALPALLCVLSTAVAYGDLLVSIGPDSIQRYDAVTGTLIGTLPPFSGAHGVTVGPDGSLYACVAGGVMRYNLETESVIEAWSPPPGGAGVCGFSANVQEIVFGPDGQAFVSDCSANRLRRLDGETGACNDSLSMACPVGLTFGSDGFIYVTSFNGNRVDRVHPETLVSTTVVTGLSGPWGIAARAGVLYVSDSISQEIRRYDEATGALLGVFVTVPDQCRGLAFGPSGRLYVATAGGVYRYEPSGAPLGLFVAGGLDCQNVAFTCEGIQGADCNSNGTSDACDIETLVSSDCNLNGIPDECETNQFATELTASDASTNSRLGAALDLSGEHLAAGAPLGSGFGSATGEGYLFRRTTSAWQEVARVKGSDSVSGDLFGSAAAIGDHVAIFGAPGTPTGAAYVFELLPNGWVQSQKLTAFDGGAGDSFGLEISLDGAFACIGAPNQGSLSGAAYIFARNGAGTWLEEAKLVPSDPATLKQFGSSVAIVGDLAVVGALGDAGSQGSVYLFRRVAPGLWVEEAKLVASDGAPNHRLGSSVSVDAELVAAGAPGESSVDVEAGAVYLFRRVSGVWTETTKLTALGSTSGAHFGQRVDLLGPRVQVGAPEQNDGGVDVGAAYLFQKFGSAWDEVQKFNASDTAPNSKFGSAVAVGDDGVVAIGASDDDSAASNAGSAYAFFFALDCDSNEILDACEIDCQEEQLVVPDNNQLRRFDRYGGFLTVVNSAFSLVRGIAVGTDGDVYVSSPAGFNRIDRFDGQTLSFLATFALGLPPGAIDDLVFGPDGDLYFGVLQQNQIYRLDGATGTFLGSFATTIGQPKALTFGPDGDLFVAMGGIVQRFNGQTGVDLGAVSSFIGTDYRDLEFGPDGLLYACDLGQDRVHSFNVATNQYLGVFVDQSITTFVAGMWGLRFDSSGDLLVSGFSNGVIGRFDGVTGAFLDYHVSTPPGQPTVLVNPSQFVFQCAALLDPDCNENGKPDTCDIAEGTSIDLDLNGIPDDCELDTDGDGQNNAVDTDDDSDGILDDFDLDPVDPTLCEDSDLDGCDDCSVGVDGFGPLPDNDPLNDGADTDGDTICDVGDTDDDNDGILDAQDPQPLDPTLCGDADLDGCDDCAVGVDGFGALPDFNPLNDGVDTDLDGECDFGDADDDNDGVLDGADLDPLDPSICGDSDGDGCDDCAVGVDGFGTQADNTPQNDGLDTDADGLCDLGDTDDDNDGVLDAGDPAPQDPSLCGDLDLDGCDDCAVGTDGFGPLADNQTANDGLDTDGDGLCDSGDVDDDNDGILDGADIEPVNPFVCGDSDGDGCDDCAVGTDGFGPLSDSTPSNDGLDTDGDGICDFGDTDDDNDGVLDTADTQPLDPSICLDSDLDGCDDCAVGTDGFGPLPDNDPSSDGLDTDSDGLCDAGDPDDDNDGVLDAGDPDAQDPSICGDSDLDGCDDCAVGTDNFGPLADNLPSNDGTDTDGDGLCDFGDLDDDNDGVLDTNDLQPLDPFSCEDQDGDGCDDCAVGTDGFGPLPDNDPLADGTDTDSDGTCDLTDTDDDNDGVLDGGDVAPFDPSVCGDTDLDGCDDCTVGTDGFGPLADNLPLADGLDTDSDGGCDFGDPDDDNDGVLDPEDPAPLEPSICGDSDLDGCDDCAVGTDGFGPLADNQPSNDGLDTDADGLCDLGDPDDDNDGVPDAGDPEPQDPSICGDSDLDGCDDCAVGTDNFGPLADNLPSNDGTDTDSDGLCDFGDPDDDNDGVSDTSDPQPLDPSLCGDSDLDGCDDCTVGTDGFGPLTDNDPLNDGLDTDSDGICDLTDSDDDNDGVLDGTDTDSFDPSICGDADLDGCDDCAVGTDGFGPLADNDPSNDGLDTDGDGVCNLTDLDDDNDGVLDGADLAPEDPFLCGDSDGDLCDDCAVGTDGFGPLPDNDPTNDGVDTNGDGVCDQSDPDDDSDGVLDGDDNAPLDPTICRDLDGDGCDDCSSGFDAPNNDGLDTDSDGLCDVGDPDDDNDGVLDGADPLSLDPTICGDVDGDGCDDCVIGTDGFGPLPDNDPSNDGTDNEGDGLCDAGDPDDDNDGVPDPLDDDPFDPTICRDLDGDGCDDCASGTDAPSNDGPDFDGDGLCDSGDPDDDNDNVADGDDNAPLDATICRDLDGDGCDDCSSGTDAPSDDGLDSDGDGLCDLGDPDDDNDGVLDARDLDPLDPFVCGDTDLDQCDDCSPLPCAPLFRRGDANGDGSHNIADPIAVLAYLFSGGVGDCLQANDTNDDNSVNIADAIALLSFLFTSGPPPEAPYPNCGMDPDLGPLTCDFHPSCP